MGGIFVIIAIVAGLWLLVEKMANVPHDTREPPLVPQPTPYIGHLLGILRDGSRYYSKVSAQFSLPIYTLRVPRIKIYIVNSPRLVAAIDRNPKTISFAPYIVQFAKRLLLPGKEGLDALAANLHEEDGPVGCRSETIKAMHHALAPGEDLERTTQDVLKSVVRLLESVYTISDNQIFDLFWYVRKLITRASTDGIYGESKNPFQDPANETGFWAIDKNFALLGLNMFPNLVTPEGHRSRATLFQGFRKYYALDGHKSASRLVQARYEVNRKYNVPMQDIEHFDLSVCYGLLVNTAPATSWTLYHIYSRPPLLQELREMISSYVYVSTDSSSGLKRTVNIAEVAKGNPLWASIIQETLRVQSTNASARVMLKDTLLDDQYLLTKDSIVLIPSAELHSDASMWGPSYQQFDPRRFIQKRDNRAARPASAYRAFGGGASTCPGRFLAANEIMIVIVIMVLKYDLSPVQGAWTLPKSRPHITTSILTPVEEVPVTVTERKGYEQGDWHFSWVK